MKQQLQNWQNIQHMLNTAKNQSTIVKNIPTNNTEEPILEEPILEEPILEEPITEEPITEEEKPKHYKKTKRKNEE